VCRMGSFASAQKNEKGNVLQERTFAATSARSLLAKSSDSAVVRALSSDCAVNVFRTLTFSSIFRTDGDIV